MNMYLHNCRLQKAEKPDGEKRKHTINNMKTSHGDKTCVEPGVEPPSEAAVVVCKAMGDVSQANVRATAVDKQGHDAEDDGVGGQRRDKYPACHAYWAPRPSCPEARCLSIPLPREVVPAEAEAHA